MERLEISQEQTEKAEKLERKLAIVAETLQSTQQQLADLPAAPDASIASVKDLDELARTVQSHEKELDDVQNGIRKHVADLDTEAALWRTRPEELVNELAEVDDRLREIEDEADGIATSGEPRELMQAHQLFLAARRQRAESERRLAQAEIDWFQSPLAEELLDAEQELAAKTLSLKVAELGMLEDELGKRRGDEADQRVHRAQDVVAQIAPALKTIAEENLELAKEQRDVAGNLRDVEHRHESTSTTLAELQKEFDRTQKMVNDVGLTDTIGLMLRQQRSRLDGFADLEIQSIPSQRSSSRDTNAAVPTGIGTCGAARPGRCDREARRRTRSRQKSEISTRRTANAARRPASVAQGTRGRLFEVFQTTGGNGRSRTPIARVVHQVCRLRRRTGSLDPDGTSVRCRTSRQIDTVTGLDLGPPVLANGWRGDLA